jgi:hypothetical protein
MGYANPSSERSMLSAMKTRDKIPRTPVEGGKRHYFKDNFVPDKPFNMHEYMRKHQANDDMQAREFLYEPLERNEQRERTMNE